MTVILTPLSQDPRSLTTILEDENLSGEGKLAAVSQLLQIRLGLTAPVAASAAPMVANATDPIPILRLWEEVQNKQQAAMPAALGGLIPDSSRLTEANAAPLVPQAETDEDEDGFHPFRKLRATYDNFGPVGKALAVVGGATVVGALAYGGYVMFENWQDSRRPPAETDETAAALFSMLG